MSELAAGDQIDVCAALFFDDKHFARVALGRRIRGECFHTFFVVEFDVGVVDFQRIEFRGCRAITAPISSGHRRSSSPAAQGKRWSGL